MVLLLPILMAAHPLILTRGGVISGGIATVIARLMAVARLRGGAACLIASAMWRGSAQEFCQNFLVFGCEGLELDTGTKFADLADQRRMYYHAVLLQMGFAANAVAGDFQYQAALGARWELFITIETGASFGYFQCHTLDDVVAAGADQGCTPTDWMALMLA